jgi:hypothetical protein
VNHAGILHVDAPAEGDRSHIAADDGVEPETAQFADGDSAGNRGVVGLEEAAAGEGKQGHGGECIGGAGRRRKFFRGGKNPEIETDITLFISTDCNKIKKLFDKGGMWGNLFLKQFHF